MHPTPSTTASPAPPPSSSFSSELDAERRASSTRVLSVWSALEEKYARRLDEDDIVDLRSGSVIRDRGVLSGPSNPWPIGCFADVAPSEEGEGDEEGAALEDEEDEIGGWGSESELDRQFEHVHVPPTRALGPEDAEDLRAFLAAEECRKEGQDLEDDVSEDDEPPDDGYSEDLRRETDESVVDVEAGSALTVSAEVSEDELDGYDATVGEGAQIWEVGSDLPENCVEPLGSKKEATPSKSKPISPLARRTQTPAQLCTPPWSRSSAMPPRMPSLPRAPPLNHSLASPIKPPTLAAPAFTSKKGKQRETPSPKKQDPRVHRGKGKTSETSLVVTPTKNIVPEVLLPCRRRASTVVRRISDAAEAAAADETTGKTPTKHRARAASNPDKIHMPQQRARTPSPTKLPRPATSSGPKHVPPMLVSESTGVDGAVSEERWNDMPPPTSPRRLTKRKRVVSEGPNLEDGGDTASAVRKTKNFKREKVGETSIRGTSPERRHRSSAFARPTASSSTPNASLRQHPTPAPEFPPPYPRYASAAPSFPGSYPPYGAHESSVPPQQALDAQLLIAQAVQSLSYLAFAGTGAGGPPPSASPHAPQMHPGPYTPSRAHPPPPPSTPSWPYPSLYYPPPASHSSPPAHPPPHPHAHPHYQPPWLYPHYPFPFPHTPHASSSPIPAGPPSSPPDHESSSPLVGKGKGKAKKVSFTRRDEDEDEDERDDRSISPTPGPLAKSGVRTPRQRRNSQGTSDGKAQASTRLGTGAGPLGTRTSKKR